MEIDNDDDVEPDDDLPDAEPEGGKPWPAWNLAVFVGDNVKIQNQVMQHPVAPQHLMDLDLSSSSMRFLRGEGPNISLDQLLIDLQLDDSSSSSSDASSVLDEDRARFVASLQHCATLSLFHRRGIPNSSHLEGSSNQPRATISFKPILIDHLATQNQEATPAAMGMEIVPWCPCLHALALQLWPDVLEARRPATHIAIQDAMMSDEVISLGEDGSDHALENGSQGPQLSSPPTFEFQTSQIHPAHQSSGGVRDGQQE